MQKICIAIITYKRPLGLKKLLNILKLQELNNNILSIIVVDNDATGKNTDIVEELKKDNYPFELNLFVEKKRGIVAARNRTVEEFLKTDIEYFIFIDDDEWPVSNDWVLKLIEAQEMTNADIVYSDVYIIPESEEIAWAKDAFRVQNSESNIVSIKKYFTNNLLIMRKVLENMHPLFDERFAMTGSSDLHFSIKANNLGYKAYYTPYAPVEEVFPLSRATYKWFFLRGYRIGDGSVRANIYEGTFPKIFFHIIILILGRFIRTFQMFFKSLFTFQKSYFLRGIIYLGAFIGSITGLFGLKYNEYKNTHGE